MPHASAAVAPVKAFFRVVTSAEARAQLAALAPKTGVETVPVVEACGRVLAKALTAPVDLPHFHRTNMDGYAVRAQDTFGASPSLPMYLKLVGTVEMGKEAKRALKKGEAMRIATGGMLPPGADSMVMVEYTEEMGDGTVEVHRSVSPWENILRVGEDIKRGAAVFSAGRRLRAHDLGALTGVGITSVPVYRRPVVALISTGDEIVAPDQTPKPGQIRNVNQYSLRAMIGEAGGEPLDLGVVKDDRPAFAKAMAQVLKKADVVMISGGSSVGTKDMTVDVISSFPRSEVFFHGISIAPGKPTIFAKAAGKPVMGLPGHPVSALVVFALFGAPLIRLVGGEPAAAAFAPPRTTRAKLAQNVASAPGREDYVRVILERKNSDVLAQPLPGKSGAVFSLVKADGMVCVPHDEEGKEAGEEIEVILF
ncbi:MAG TPA: gephyrin-like molybdotransferase Glp [Candidatus Binatia bacterium]|nr:gephyrin-like molybdotransferase Glp [Candidatus Binatia bacterium]